MKILDFIQICLLVQDERQPVYSVETSLTSSIFVPLFISLNFFLVQT